ncbi:hypothetical protein Mal65_11280 [Crateriforma conspicua]|nr:hypothetical protein Mal65_11280 [Crateriforma conspicua]
MYKLFDKFDMQRKLLLWAGGAGLVVFFLTICFCVLTTLAGCDSPKEIRSSRESEVVCDYGVIAPGTRHSERVTHGNPRPNKIVFERFIVGCKCLKPRIAERTVDPGGTIEIDIDLDAASVPQDIDFPIDCIFADSRGGTFLLQLRAVAKIRSELFVDRTGIQWQLYHGQLATPASLRVENRSGKAWNKLGFREHVKDSFSVDVERVAPGTNALESWEVRVAPLDSMISSPGTTQRSLEFISPGGHSGKVSLQLSVFPPVRLFPDRVFCGPDGPIEGKLTVTFQMLDPPRSSTDFILRNPIPDQLECGVDQLDSGEFQMWYRLTSLGAPFRGELVLDIPSHGVSADIPLVIVAGKQ